MKWVTFVGEGRSGHTAISGALGSHPHARIAEEQKYISKYRRGWDRDKILSALHTSGAGATRKRQGWPNLTNYTEPLLVVGDKCGWDAVNEYTKRDAPASIIDDFGAFMDMPVKVIVTVRNPVDNIPAWVSSPKYKRMYADDKLRLRRMIRRYKRFYDAAWEVVKDTDYFIVHSEKLIVDSNTVLQELSDWLELPKDKSWRRNTAQRIFTEPHLRRGDIVWPGGYYQNRLEPFINLNPLMEFYR